MTNIFTGLITALITPFKKGKIDFYSLEKILKYQIDANINGIVIAGSTGEGSSLNFEEYKSLIDATINITKRAIPIIVGSSSNNINFSISLAQECTKMQVDGLMFSVPPYIKPTSEGIYRYFESIHNASKLPIMLYSVPSRTSTDFNDETIFRLSALPRIIALKDASGDLERPLRIKARTGNKFNLLSGNDETCLAFNAQGGVGCVSVASNIVPKLCKQLQDDWSSGNISSAFKIQQYLLPLYNALFIESNPIPVKYSAHYLNLCLNELRLPLTEATSHTIIQIKKTMQDLFKNESGQNINK